MENSKLLKLPHPRYLKTLLMMLDTENSNLSSGHIKYLTEKLKKLDENAKFVTLMLEEIYVKKNISYKGGKIVGADIQSVDTSTIQTFMISSIYCHNKDVVGLFPATNLKYDFSYMLVLQILKLLTEAGYHVLCMISDNNGVNRKMYEEICGGVLRVSFLNPVNPDIKTFTLFDGVHILKTIRNIWLNQKDPKQTFVIPKIPENLHERNCSFDTDTKLFACVGDLKNVYREEQNNIIKLAPSLDRKVLYPTSIERQNVSLCLRLFDEKNIAALKMKYANDISCVEGAIAFLKLIGDWWKIINCNSFYKDIRLRDPRCAPIQSVDDENLIFLENFLKWLELWNNLEVQGEPKKSRNGKLTLQTQLSLTHSLKTIIALCRYLTDDLQFQYILLFKFQTDALEDRFGKYRQMSGGNYHISVMQVLESERTLKMLSVLKLKSSNKGEFSLKEFLDSCEQESSEDENELVEKFEDALIAEDEAISQDEAEVLVYIAGYIAHRTNMTLKCIQCKSLISHNRKLEVDSCNRPDLVYLKHLDRGGLKWPKKFLVEIVSQMFVLFKVLIGQDFEIEFIKVRNQRVLLKKLAIEMLIYKDTSMIYGTCECGECPI
jgi:hypothetical protein